MTTGSFVDYVNGGTEINLIVGIDYTGSNGEPNSEGSLHYQDPEGGFNAYMQAIHAVGEVIAPYDADQKISCFWIWSQINCKEKPSEPLFSN